MNEVGYNRCKKITPTSISVIHHRNTTTLSPTLNIPKINSNNTLKKRWKCSKLTIKTPEEDRSTSLLSTLSNFYLLF